MYFDGSSSSKGDPLNAYLRDISGIYPLTRDEEKKLAICGDEASLAMLVERNLKYVVMVANRYKGLGMSLADLINEGNIGMMEAARRFDPERGVKFITYAVWWVRQNILRALADQASVVRLPIKQAGIIYKIAKSVEGLKRRLQREPTLEELAENLGLKMKSLERVMRVYRGYMSLDSPLNDEEGSSFLDMLAAEPEHSIEEDYIRLCLHHDLDKMLRELPERQAVVLRMRFGFNGPPLTLENIGNRLGLTRERVRQIEKSAKIKLRSKIGIQTLEDYLH